jgi:hypothetical protein
MEAGSHTARGVLESIEDSALHRNTFYQPEAGITVSTGCLFNNNTGTSVFNCLIFVPSFQISIIKPFSFWQGKLDLSLGENI